MATPTYGQLIGCDLPNMLDPNKLPRHLSDGELAARKRKAAQNTQREASAPPVPSASFRGHNAWGSFALRSANVYQEGGSGKGGAFTKADILSIFA